MSKDKCNDDMRYEEQEEVIYSIESEREEEYNSYKKLNNQ